MILNFTMLGFVQLQGSTSAFIPIGWTRTVITTDTARLKTNALGAVR